MTFAVSDYETLDQHYKDIIDMMYGFIDETGKIDTSYTLTVNNVGGNKIVTLEKVVSGTTYKCVIRGESSTLYLEYYVDAVKETYKNERTMLG